MNKLHKAMARLVELGEITQAQSTAICACVEVEYDGCPDDFAEELEPLMEKLPEEAI